MYDSVVDDEFDDVFAVDAYCIPPPPIYADDDETPLYTVVPGLLRNAVRSRNIGLCMYAHPWIECGYAEMDDTFISDICIAEDEWDLEDYYESLEQEETWTSGEDNDDENETTIRVWKTSEKMTERPDRIRNNEFYSIMLFQPLGHSVHGGRIRNLWLRASGRLFEEVSAEGGGDIRRRGPRSGARRPGWRRGDSGKGGDNRKEELASPQTPLRVNPADPLDERTRRQRGSELLSIIMFVHLRFIESNSLCFVPVMTLHLLHGILVTLQCFRIL